MSEDQTLQFPTYSEVDRCFQMMVPLPIKVCFDIINKLEKRIFPDHHGNRELRIIDSDFGKKSFIFKIVPNSNASFSYKANHYFELFFFAFFTRWYKFWTVKPSHFWVTVKLQQRTSTETAILIVPGYISKMGFSLSKNMFPLVNKKGEISDNAFETLRFFTGFATEILLMVLHKEFLNIVGEALFFICYRHQDSIHITGRIFDRLKDYFGPGTIFKDLESIPLGEYRKIQGVTCCDRGSLVRRNG